MPDGTDDAYSSPQINIPPTFPFILKQYAKAAIRTQPYDLLKWSASYFRALAKGETPPIKDRLEYPPPDTPSGLSPGYLKVLIKQIGKSGFVTVDQLVERWNGICLAEGPLHEMLTVGQFGETLDWLHFVAVAAGFLCNNLTQTMVLLCNLLTDEPEGGSALIPLPVFSKLYTFLAGLNCGNPLEADDEENEREYVLPDDSSILVSDMTSSTQIILKSEKLSPSVNMSPNRTPCNTPPYSPLADKASTATLTPETTQFLNDFEGNDIPKTKSSEGTVLETFYDSKLQGSHGPSEELISGENEIEELQSSELQDAKYLKDDSSNDSLVGTLDPKVDESSLEQNVISSASAVESGPGHDSPAQKQETISKSKLKADADHSQHVPGIGPVVDSVQVNAVLDYLRGISQKQGGMVKPGNIRHFLCPPLEKVPASQKTKV